MLEIFTNAPSALDCPGSKVVGDFGLGLLRVVSVSGLRVTAKEQIRRYEECGFFATLFRNDAIAFLAERGGYEYPSVSDFHMPNGEGAR